jgi:dTDP-4-amino-4,6-dideoxygalactose transaminase
MKVPFALPYIGPEEEEAVLRVLRSGWLTTGTEALSLEREFTDFIKESSIKSEIFNRKVEEVEKVEETPTPFFSLAVNSATSGLHLALEALGVGPGDVVLVPSLTFTSTAEVARYLGADVAFVDVAPGTFHIDPNLVEKTVKRLAAGLSAYEKGGPKGRPAVIMPVHYGGLVCDMDALMATAKRYGAAVVEDAAHSFPCPLPGGHFAGAIGDVGVYSFYATKTMTCGEGGMVVTANPDIAARISTMRLHGIDRTVWNRYSDKAASWYYEVVAPGYKYNLPDILASIARVQLGRAQMLLEKRQSIAALYDAAFSGDPHFITPPTAPHDARHLYPLRVVGTSRDGFIEKLKVHDIGVSVHFIPLHTMPYYKSRYDLSPADFPETMKSYENEVSLPIWPGMTEEMVEAVVEAATK